MNHQAINSISQKEKQCAYHFTLDSYGSYRLCIAAQLDHAVSHLAQGHGEQRGSLRIRSLITTPLIALSLLSLGGCERWSLDRQMEALCKKDGGIKVYETVTLPASEFSDTGEPLARYVPIAKSPEDYFGPDYRYVLNIEILVGPHADATKGEGQLRRVHNLIYRRSDSRLLGEQVWYDRSGGDGFTFGFQPSGKSCPYFTSGLAQSVFTKGE